MKIEKNYLFWRIIVICVLLSQTVNANDTILTQVYSKSVFYNFFENTDGTLYVGASDGLYKIIDGSLEKVNNESGYIEFKNNQITRSTFFGVELTHRYKNILPAHYGEFLHQSIDRKNNIYLICRGTLFMYEVKPYEFKFKGKSIRSFSENSIGTYSGVFIYGNPLKIPNYTSGEIFERDSIFYICYDGVAIHSPKSGTKLFKRENTNETQIGNINLGFSREIFQFQDRSFLLSTSTGLHLIDSTFIKVETIFETKNNVVPIIIDVLDVDHEKIISFGTANKFYNYSVNQKELDLKATFGSSIEDGYKLQSHLANRFVLLLNDEAIIYNDYYVSYERISGMNGAHSVISIGNDTSLISTQNGAHLLYLKSKKISSRLFEGIEFNKRALWKKGDTLKLGSTDGYIEIIKSDLLKIQNDLIINRENKKLANYNIWFFAVFILIIAILGLLVYVRNKSKRLKNDVEKEITRNDIEEYIQSNLKNVSIKDIKDYFNISNKSLYKIIAPEKPGIIISNFRKLKVKELISKGESFKAISEETGFSISYLRKLKT